MPIFFPNFLMISKLSIDVEFPVQSYLMSKIQ